MLHGLRRLWHASPFLPMAGWNSIAWLTLACYSFATSALIFRGLGARQFGIWATVTAVRGLLVFLDGGLALGVTRDTALTGTDPGVKDRLMAARWVYLALGVTVLGLAVLFSNLPGSVLHLPHQDSVSARVVTIFVAIETALSLASSPLAAMIRGKERFDVLARSAVLQTFVGLVALGLLIGRWGLAGAAVALLVARACLVGNYYLWLRVKARTPLALTHVQRPVIWSVLRFAAPVWVIAIGSQIGVGTDVPIVGAFYGAVPASHYALGALLPAGGAAALWVVLDVTFPRLSSFVRDDVVRLVRALLLIGCGLAALGFGTLALNASTILSVWIGSAPSLAVNVMVIYSITWALNIPNHILVLAAIGRARHRMLAPVVLAEALANLALSVSLAALWSPLGPSLATLGTLFVSNIVVVPALIVRRLHVSWTTVARRVAVGYGLGSVLSLLVWAAVAPFRDSPRVALMVAAGATAVAAAVLMATVRFGLQLLMMSRFAGWSVWWRQRREVRANRSVLEELRRSHPIVWRQSEPPLVTVRIATYNRARLVAERAIASALAQSYPNLEVVVVGDRCDVETELAVRSVRDSRVRFENLPEHGRYPDNPLYRWMVVGIPPMNRGLDLARGEWIAPLDDDDEFTKDHVERLLDECRTRELEFVYGVAEMEASPGRWEQVGSWPPRQGAIVHASVLYWAGLRFMRYDIEGWRVRDPGDWSLWRRMRDSGVRMGFLDHVVCRHYLEKTEAQPRASTASRLPQAL